MKLCYKQLTEIAEACLDCDSHLDCFPMDDETAKRLGYDTTGIGRKRGLEKIAVCVVNHKGDHNDTICLVERTVPQMELNLLASNIQAEAKT